MTTESDFAAIERVEKAITVGGRDLTLRPLTIGQLPGFARALKAALPAIAALMEDGRKVDAEAIADLIAEHGENVLEALAIASRLPRADVDALDPVAALELVAEVLAINRDFFVRRLAPALTKAREAVTTAGGGAGPT